MPKAGSLLARCCRQHARRVARFPLLHIAITLIIAVGLAVGIKDLVIDTDPNVIWVPPDSTTASQKRFFDAAFDPFFRVNQIIVSLDPSVPQDNITQTVGILQQPFFAAVLDLQTRLSNSSAGDGTLLSDVCYRPIPGQGCLVESPLDYFRSNATAVSMLTPSLIQDALSCRTILGQTTIPCMSSIGIPVQTAVVLGGARCPLGDVPGYNKSICGQCGTYADALILTFLLENTPAAVPRALSWEHDVFLSLASSFSYPGLTVSYMAERSIQDQLAVVDSQNQNVVVISYCVMLAYIALALGKFPHPIATRALLGFQGICVVALSVAAAIGVLAAAGLHITMIVTEVVPFLILAIGVDNMFILTKAFDGRWWGPVTGARVAALRRRGVPTEPNPDTPHHSRISRGATSRDGDDEDADADGDGDEDGEALGGTGLDIESAAVEALAEVGPTITAAAASELLAFALGASTNIPALQQFCSVAALAVGVDYLLQMTWFLAAIILDARRQESRRADILFCCRLRGPGVRATACSCPRLRTRNSAEEEVGGDDEGDGDAGFNLLSAADGGGHTGSGKGRQVRGPSLEETFVEDDTRSATIDVGLDAGYGNVYAATTALERGEEEEGAEHSGSSGSGRSDVVRGAAPSVLAALADADADGAGGGGAGGASSLFVAPRRSFAAPISSLNDGRARPLLDTSAAATGAGGGVGARAGRSGSVALRDIARASAVAGSLEVGNSAKLRAWYRINRGHYVRSFLQGVYVPVLFLWPVRLLVIAVWLLAVGGSFYAATQLQLGLEQQLVLPEGSYLKPYFTQQSALGDAGPPVYLVLQNVNYTHPSATAAISDMANAVGGLTQYIVPPFFSWVADFAIWTSPDTRSLVIQHQADWQCPYPLDPSNNTYASLVAQYVYDIAIPSPCCQDRGYCGGQYATDIQFLWGVPKTPAAAVSAADADAATDAGADAVAPAFEVVASGYAQELVPAALGVTKTGGSVVRTTRSATAREPALHSWSVVEEAGGGYRQVDDGGCDLSVGYIRQDHVEAALAAAAATTTGSGSRKARQPVQLSSRVTLPVDGNTPAGAAALAALPAGVRARLLASPAASVSAATVTAGVGSRAGGVQLIPCHIMTSRLRGASTPLRNQSDFITTMQHVQAAVSTLQATLPTVDLAALGVDGYGPLAPGDNSSAVDDNQHTWWLPPAPGGAAFPYSLVYVYYEQYNYIRGVALQNVLLAVGAVFMAIFLVTEPAVAAVTAGLVASITLCLVGWVYILNPTSTDPNGSGPWGVDINAVSVVNWVTAAGLGVEFAVHIAAAFAHTPPVLAGAPPGATRAQANLARAKYALVHMGASVVTGITVTKFCGVCVLAWAPSILFRLYYFRVYLGIIVLGAFHGLALLPVLLSICGLPVSSTGAHIRLSKA